MEKQDAAMESRLPAFICATMSSRSVLLMLLINSIYLKQPPSRVSTGDNLLHTLRGVLFVVCLLAVWAFVELWTRLIAECTLHGAKIQKSLLNYNYLLKKFSKPSVFPLQLLQYYSNYRLQFIFTTHPIEAFYGMNIFLIIIYYIYNMFIIYIIKNELKDLGELDMASFLNCNCNNCNISYGKGWLEQRERLTLS